jgi:hypothetical protein
MMMNVEAGAGSSHSTTSSWEVRMTKQALWRLYVDETGDHTYYEEKLANLIEKRYLGLGGCAIEKTAADRLAIRFEEIKRQMFSHHDFDLSPLILHRKHIIERKGPYCALQNAKICQVFDDLLLEEIANTPFVFFIVVLDKKVHRIRWGSLACHPYHYCLTNLVERYVLFLKKDSKYGDVLAESRGGTEDKELILAYNSLWTAGSVYVQAPILQQVLTSSQIKLQKKGANIAGLQLCDLIVKDAAYLVLNQYQRISGMQEPRGFRAKLAEILKQKYCRSAEGAIDGYGIKTLF